MQNNVLEVSIKAVVPAANANGCAIFLGAKNKTFHIHVEGHIGKAISMAINKARPLTHDLIGNIFQGFGIELDRVIINDFNKEFYFARIILKMKNELGVKIVEIDSRPSDSMVLAVQCKKPIMVAEKVLNEAEDMTEVLESILKQKN